MIAVEGSNTSNGLRTCWDCKERKSLDLFSGIKKSYRCKSCQGKYSNRLRMKKLYGITVEQYDQMLVSQKNKCKICSVDFNLSTNRKHAPNIPCVDHDHKTGIVRGILCGKCNRAIGLFYDDTDSLLNAMAYLMRVNLDEVELVSVPKKSWFKRILGR